MKILDTYILVKFSNKTGKINDVLEASGQATLKLWALHNTPKAKNCVIFNKETGLVSFMIEGTDDLPQVIDLDDKELYIDDYCPGILDAVNTED